MRKRDKYFRDVDPKTRFIMSRIRSNNTSLEKKLCLLLWQKGYRYRKNVKTILGKPDVVFRSKKLLIFCDSGFWHGKNLKQKAKRIKHNNRYWVDKLKKNIIRDKYVTKKLRSSGWKVMRFWDEDIEKRPERILGKIQDYLGRPQKD